MTLHRFSVAIARNELDLDLCLGAGQVFRFVRSGTTWEGVDGSDWYRLSQTEAGVEVESSAPEPAFRSLFSLDRDVAGERREIGRLLPDSRAALAVTEGLRPMRPSDPSETLFSFLCTSNNHVARISGMVASLASLGPTIPDVEGARAFPDLAALAKLEEAWLRGRGFGYRAATIPKVARSLYHEKGPDALGALGALGYPRAREALSNLPGVGPKIADCVCLFGLGFGEAVPVDVHVRNAYCRLQSPAWSGKSLTQARYDEVGDWLRGRVGPLAGHAHQVLFVDELRHWRERRAPVPSRL